MIGKDKKDASVWFGVVDGSAVMRREYTALPPEFPMPSSIRNVLTCKMQDIFPPALCRSPSLLRLEVLQSLPVLTDASKQFSTVRRPLVTDHDMTTLTVDLGHRQNKDGS